MATTYKLFCGGAVQFVDPRVARPVTFAHVTDVHLPGVPREAWPERYRGAIEWWNVDMGYPDRVLDVLLDEIKSANVDFVCFGGDTIDYYNAGAAEHVITQCKKRGLQAYFQLGNHDSESEYLRFVTHEFDADVFAENSRKLCGHWSMPALDYVFELGGVRFMAMSIEYKHVADDIKGIVTTAQADWFIEQMRFDGPIVIFHHIPFALPTIAPRLRQFWSGNLACIAEDANGRRVVDAISQSPDVLGTFTGHAHMRSEDPFGPTWQFMTGPAHSGRWRYVKIHNQPPPKSLAIAGTPDVEP